MRWVPKSGQGYDITACPVEDRSWPSSMTCMGPQLGLEYQCLGWCLGDAGVQP